MHGCFYFSFFSGNLEEGFGRDSPRPGTPVAVEGNFFLHLVNMDIRLGLARPGSAWLVTFFTSARNRKSAKNEQKFDSQLKIYF